jgi:hypothetical protein
MRTAAVNGFSFKALFLSVPLRDAAQYLFHCDGVIGVVWQDYVDSR